MSEIKLSYDLAIVGAVGLPSSYGGFETLAEQLSRQLSKRKYKILVFCTGSPKDSKGVRPSSSDGADLKYVNWNANGWQSVVYDSISLLQAAPRSSSILVLGVSGCFVLPLIRMFWRRTRIVTNIDGLEWRRKKWGHIAALFLRVSEWFAVQFSHDIISDNQGIKDHIYASYGKKSSLIAYGGDQAAMQATSEMNSADSEIRSYYLSICRIEPENNIDKILKAFLELSDEQLVIVGNWNASEFGKKLRVSFSGAPNISLKDPVYDQFILQKLKNYSKGYIHGHSAGGTNPSLVEAMHAGKAIFAFDVIYNRYTTYDKAVYWSDSEHLSKSLIDISPQAMESIGKDMKQLARQHYTWDGIAREYQDILFRH
jgi:glycosyltransferase involved in cell wall biosynthesis